MYIKVANWFAKNSCPLYCDYGVIRRPCRAIYRWLAENPMLYRHAMQKRGVTAEMLAYPAELPFDVNTYPPLYSNWRFAPWEEIADPDDPKQYNLISSSGGQVIRRSPSYCDYKIFELTGQHLARNIPGRFDAAHWVEYLAQAGYETVVERPRPGHHYVGVIPDYGEFGHVVWFGMLGKACQPSESDALDAASRSHPSRTMANGRDSHGHDSSDSSSMAAVSSQANAAIVADQANPSNSAAQPKRTLAGRWYSDNFHRFYVAPADEDDSAAAYYCSTYEGFQFHILRIEPGDRRVTWVQID